jgi:hypothetical protein
MDDVDPRPWHAHDEDLEVGRAVRETVDMLKEFYRSRHADWARYTGLYEGHAINSMSPLAYQGTFRNTRLNYNLHRSGCDTAQAEIAGRQRPKPSFMSRGADWRTRRRAKKLDLFVESALRQPQGNYADGWELASDVELDAQICGTGFIKVLAGEDGVVLERVLAHEVLLDPLEASAGDPRNWFHCWPISREAALEQFAGDDLPKEERLTNALAIRGAEKYDYGHDQHAASGVVDMVEVTEAWHLSRTDAPGRHVYCIGEHVVHSEDWEDPGAPFAVQRWARERCSWWGKGLVAEGEGIVAEVNEQAEKLQRRFRLCGNKRTYVTEDSVDIKAMQSNEDENLILVRQGAQHPTEAPINPVGSAEVNWLVDNFQRYYELTGVSFATATARKEQGITADVAMRTLNNMQAARLAPKGRGYENLFVQIGRLIVRRAREVASKNDFKLPYPGSDFHGEISWKDVDLEEDQFTIHVAPASSLPSDPAGRLQMAQELFSAGVITPQTFKRMLDMADIEDETKAESAERDYLEWLVDQYLDVEEDDNEDFRFTPPEGYIIDKQSALVFVAREYFQARRQGAPEYNLGLLRTYMNQLSKMIDREQAAMMQAQQGAQPGPRALPGAA